MSYVQRATLGGLLPSYLEHRYTDAPSSARRSTVALPMPAVAAVTRATLPSSLLHWLLLALVAISLRQ